jgi:septal ring factor EnvC (AmiA/AmiB activator)
VPFLCLFLQRLSNGSIDSTDETSQLVELQELLEKQNYEMAQMKERLAALSSRVGEVEQEAETARKDLIKTEEMNTKYQRDIREVSGSYYFLCLLPRFCL